MNKKKISRLYTSFRKNGKGHRLSAYCAVDVFSFMQELLKFPTLYKDKDLPDYIISTRIISKKRNPQGKLITGYSIPTLEFIAEDWFITPSTLSLAAVEQNYVYFTFKQQFNYLEARKYEFQMEILDLSISKALKLKKQAIRTISALDWHGIPDEPSIQVSKKLFQGQGKVKALELTKLCAKLQGITGYHKEIYDKAQKENYLITKKTYNLIRNEIMRDISYIDQAIDTNTRDPRVGADSTAVSRWANPVRSIKSEFGEVVAPKIKQNLSSDLEVFNNLVSNPPNQVLYTSTMEIPAVVVNSLPTIEDKFEKFHRYEDTSTLKQKAGSLSLDFACLDVDIEDFSETSITSIESQDLDDIYVLVGHANACVSSPNFVLLSEISPDLLNNSTYLCKTHYIDAENQYFLLGT